MSFSFSLIQWVSVTLHFYIADGKNKNVTALVNAQFKEQHAIHELLKQTIKQINKETVTETESNLFSQMQKQVPQHMLSCVICIASQDTNLQ